MEPLRAGDGKLYAASIARMANFGFDSLSSELRRFLARESVRLSPSWSLVFSDTESPHLWSASQRANGDPEIERRILLAEADGDDIGETPGANYVRTAYWHKIGGTPQFTGDRPAVGCEAITIMHAKMTSGRMAWNGGGSQGVYAYPIVLDRGGKGGLEPRLHTTQKPEKLMIELVEDFTNPERTIDGKTAPASTIYDFTAGVCTTGIGALRANGGHRYFVGCELDPVVDLDDCAVCGRDVAAHKHKFGPRRSAPAVCKTCGGSKDDHGHEFAAKRARVWADRGAMRLDAELSGSTYTAKNSGQLSLLDCNTETS